MLLVRTGGSFGVLVTLIVAGVLMFVVRPAINDMTSRAVDLVDPAQQQRDDYLSAAAFAAAVDDIKAELGTDAELLDLTVSKDGGGNVKYRVGDRAAGYTWGPGREGLQLVEVTLVGTGKLEDNVFPIAKLAPSAATTLTAAAKATAGADFEAQTMTLARAPVSGAVQWTVTGAAGGRSLVLTARANGRGLELVN